VRMIEATSQISETRRKWLTVSMLSLLKRP
jgi:hypothetical protein